MLPTSAGFMLRALNNPEEGRDKFLRNVSLSLPTTRRCKPRKITSFIIMVVRISDAAQYYVSHRSPSTGFVKCRLCCTYVFLAQYLT
jgi:hypothetical protein